MLGAINDNQKRESSSQIPVERKAFPLRPTRDLVTETGTEKFEWELTRKCAEAYAVHKSIQQIARIFPRGLLSLISK